MNTKKIESKETAPGEYGDLFELLMKELKLFKRKFILSLRSVSTNEPQRYGLRYFEKQYQAEVLRLFNEERFEEILRIPVGEVGRCATQLECRYIDSGKIVGLQVNEARPHEGGRYVGLTPAKVFLDEEGEKLVRIAAQINQKS